MSAFGGRADIRIWPGNHSNIAKLPELLRPKVRTVPKPEPVTFSRPEHFANHLRPTRAGTICQGIGMTMIA
jgi:hypothetical protein